MYGELIFYSPWKFKLLPLLRSDFEDIKCCFVDEKCVDEADENFVCAMQKLTGYWFLDALKGYKILDQELSP